MAPTNKRTQPPDTPSLVLRGGKKVRKEKDDIKNLRVNAYDREKGKHTTLAPDVVFRQYLTGDHAKEIGVVYTKEEALKKIQGRIDVMKVHLHSYEVTGRDPANTPRMKQLQDEIAKWEKEYIDISNRVNEEPQTQEETPPETPVPEPDNNELDNDIPLDPEEVPQRYQQEISGQSGEAIEIDQEEMASTAAALGGGGSSAGQASGFVVKKNAPSYSSDGSVVTFSGSRMMYSWAYNLREVANPFGQNIKSAMCSYGDFTFLPCGFDIPWDWIPFYCTPAEFDSLDWGPRGRIIEIDSVECKVTPVSKQVFFTTGSADTNPVSTEHAAFIFKCDGLNQIPGVMFQRLQLSNGGSMNPTEGKLAPIDYGRLRDRIWGSRNRDTDRGTLSSTSVTGNVPMMFGVSRELETVNGLLLDNPKEYNMGHPAFLAEVTDTVPYNQAMGQPFVMQTYKPTCGLLQDPRCVGPMYSLGFVERFTDASRVPKKRGSTSQHYGVPALHEDRLRVTSILSHAPLDFCKLNPFSRKWGQGNRKADATKLNATDNEISDYQYYQTGLIPGQLIQEGPGTTQNLRCGMSSDPMTMRFPWNNLAEQSRVTFDTTKIADTEQNVAFNTPPNTTTTGQNRKFWDLRNHIITSGAWGHGDGGIEANYPAASINLTLLSNSQNTTLNTLGKIDDSLNTDQYVYYQYLPGIRLDTNQIVTNDQISVDDGYTGLGYNLAMYHANIERIHSFLPYGPDSDQMPRAQPVQPSITIGMNPILASDPNTSSTVFLKASVNWLVEYKMVIRQTYVTPYTPWIENAISKTSEAMKTWFGKVLPPKWSVTHEPIRKEGFFAPYYIKRTIRKKSDNTVAQEVGEFQAFPPPEFQNVHYGGRLFQGNHTVQSSLYDDTRNPVGTRLYNVSNVANRVVYTYQ